MFANIFAVFFFFRILYFARRCLSRFVAILFQFLLVAAAVVAAVVVAVVVVVIVVVAAGRVESCGMHFNAYFVIVGAAAMRPLGDLSPGRCLRHICMHTHTHTHTHI